MIERKILSSRTERGEIAVLRGYVLMIYSCLTTEEASKILDGPLSENREELDELIEVGLIKLAVQQDELRVANMKLLNLHINDTVEISLLKNDLDLAKLAINEWTAPVDIELPEFKAALPIIIGNAEPVWNSLNNDWSYKFNSAESLSIALAGAIEEYNASLASNILSISI